MRETSEIVNDYLNSLKPVTSEDKNFKKYIEYANNSMKKSTSVPNIFIPTIISKNPKESMDLSIELKKQNKSMYKKMHKLRKKYINFMNVFLIMFITFAIFTPLQTYLRSINYSNNTIVNYVIKEIFSIAYTFIVLLLDYYIGLYYFYFKYNQDNTSQYENYKQDCLKLLEDNKD